VEKVVRDADYVVKQVFPLLESNKIIHPFSILQRERTKRLIMRQPSLRQRQRSIDDCNILENTNTFFQEIQVKTVRGQSRASSPTEEMLNRNNSDNVDLMKEKTKLIRHSSHSHGLRLVSFEKPETLSPPTTAPAAGVVYENIIETETHQQPTKKKPIKKHKKPKHSKTHHLPKVQDTQKPVDFSKKTMNVMQSSPLSFVLERASSPPVPRKSNLPLLEPLDGDLPSYRRHTSMSRRRFSNFH
jgi:hypothetical protein